MVVEVFILVLGILTVLAPHIDRDPAMNLSLAITGAVLIANGVAAIVATRSRRPANFFPGITVAAGIWLIVSLGNIENNGALFWSDTGLGIAAIVTAFAVALPSLGSRATRDRKPTQGAT